MLNDEQLAYVLNLRIAYPGLLEAQLRESLASAHWNDQQIIEALQLYQTGSSTDQVSSPSPRMDIPFAAQEVSPVFATAPATPAPLPPKKKRHVFLIAFGILLLVIFVPAVYKEVKMRNEYAGLGLSRDQQKTLSQFEDIVATKKAQQVQSLEVGLSSDPYGVKLVDTVIAQNKQHLHFSSFLLPNGKFGYETFRLVGGTDEFVFDGKKISKAEYADLKPTEEEFYNSIVNYSRGNEGYSAKYKSELAHIENGDLIYEGKKIASGVADFKEVGGKIAYTTGSIQSKRTLFFDGKESATSTDPWFDYSIIASKLAYGDSTHNAMYDGKELPGTFINLNPRDVGGKLAYSRWLGKESDKGSLFYDGKEYPYEGTFTGNNEIVEINGKLIFTTFGLPSNFYYDGKKVGMAGHISDLITVGSTSPIYFFTTDEDKDNTIFSIYEIRRPATGEER